MAGVNIIKCLILDPRILIVGDMGDNRDLLDEK